MVYDTKNFKPANLRRQARTTAEFRQATPQSQLAQMKEETRTVKRWFSSSTTTTRSQGADLAGGWIILVDRADGRVAQNIEDPRYAHTRSFERGQLLILTLTGDLEVSDYRIESHTPHRGNTGNPSKTHTLTDTHPATDQDLAIFDRLNRANYRQTKPAGHHDLGHDWQIRVPHAGMEVSRALKNFKEHGTYIQQLQILY
jgi:hypothetical protein